MGPRQNFGVPTVGRELTVGMCVRTDTWRFCDCQAVQFINNVKAERSGKDIDVEILEGELPDDVRHASLLRFCCDIYGHEMKLSSEVIELWVVVRSASVLRSAQRAWSLGRLTGESYRQWATAVQVSIMSCLCNQFILLTHQWMF